MNAPHARLVTIFVGVLSATCAAGTIICDPQWDQQLVSGVSLAPGASEYTYHGIISSFAVHDDGRSGLSLFAGGIFTEAGDVPALNVARWDGLAWHAVGDGLPGQKPVTTMCVHDDGSGPKLYAAFSVDHAPTLYAVARWDGVEWTQLPGVFNNFVRILASIDLGDGPVLYVGGNFTQVDGAALTQLGRWNGTGWTQFAAIQPFNGWVSAIAAYDEYDGMGPKLFVGGRIDQIGIVGVGNLGRWDGAQWSTPGWLQGGGLLFPNVFSGEVHDLVVHEVAPGTGFLALYVSGRFDTADSLPCLNIARWTGGGWLQLGGGLDEVATATPGYVIDMQVLDEGVERGPSLFARGWIDTADGMPANGIARWDGLAWHALDGGVESGYSFFTSIPHRKSMAAFDDGIGTGPALWVGGCPLDYVPACIPFSRWGRLIADGDADLFCDGLINGFDLATLLGAWGDCPKRGECPADLDDDGIVNGNDLAILLNEWD